MKKLIFTLIILLFSNFAFASNFCNKSADNTITYCIIKHSYETHIPITDSSEFLRAVQVEFKHGNNSVKYAFFVSDVTCRKGFGTAYNIAVMDKSITNKISYNSDGTTIYDNIIYWMCM